MWRCQANKFTITLTINPKKTNVSISAKATKVDPNNFSDSSGFLAEDSKNDPNSNPQPTAENDIGNIEPEKTSILLHFTKTITEIILKISWKALQKHKTWWFLCDLKIHCR